MKTPNDTLPELEAMRDGVEYKFPVTIRKFTVHLRPLTNMEIIHVAREVVEETRRMENASQVEESILTSHKQLEKASTSDPETYDPKLTGVFLAKLTPGELDFLWKQYLAGCDRCNPSMEALNKDVVMQLVEQVKKSPNVQFALTDRSFLELVNISLHLIENT